MAGVMWYQMRYCTTHVNNIGQNVRGSGRCLLGILSQMKGEGNYIFLPFVSRV
jgi:hypothetical protein